MPSFARGGFAAGRSRSFIGPVSFDQYGDITGPFRLWRIQDGVVTTVGEMSAEEVEKIKAFYETQIERFRENEADPALVALRDPKDVPAGMDVPEVAAWTMVARTMLNLDETVTKE